MNQNFRINKKNSSHFVIINWDLIIEKLLNTDISIKNQHQIILIFVLMESKNLKKNTMKIKIRK